MDAFTEGRKAFCRWLGPLVRVPDGLPLCTAFTDIRPVDTLQVGEYMPAGLNKKPHFGSEVFLEVKAA